MTANKTLHLQPALDGRVDQRVPLIGCRVVRFSSALVPTAAAKTAKQSMTLAACGYVGGELSLYLKL